MTSADAAATVPHGRLRRIGRAVLYGLVVGLVVTALAFLIRSKFDPLIDADDGAIKAATDITRTHGTLRDLLITWQRLSSPTVVYVVATLVCLWVWRAKHLTTRALWAFVTMMIGWNVALDVKYLVQRARPVVEDPVSHAPGYSFPSGHAANATIGATALVLLLWPLLHRTAAKALAITAASLFVVVTCLDRVFLGVHFPSDVAGGVLLGAGLVIASYAGYVDWRPATLDDDHDHHDNNPAISKEPT
ncbi:phosphatase PAP2 family protein [Luteipulveratus sp. YIM 133132]|uniref:phosphatase PAP2 family protein n=1 Tax=Luteipulveratus flavus TaxID=3031728 RepID=UPI0023B011DA|nr:phosphatase PAP2 family protein [Luteipulveratus sp. YIM 133132]MDE9366376.1 phosphatase PAP2 family protein [Luteipulveratus sp. YIM 133132]